MRATLERASPARARARARLFDGQRPLHSSLTVTRHGAVERVRARRQLDRRRVRATRDELGRTEDLAGGVRHRDIVLERLKANDVKLVVSVSAVKAA